MQMLVLLAVVAFPAVGQMVALLVVGQTFHPVNGQARAQTVALPVVGQTSRPVSGHVVALLVVWLTSHPANGQAANLLAYG